MESQQEKKILQYFSISNSTVSQTSLLLFSPLISNLQLSSRCTSEKVNITGWKKQQHPGGKEMNSQGTTCSLFTIYDSCDIGIVVSICSIFFFFCTQLLTTKTNRKTEKAGRREKKKDNWGGKKGKNKEKNFKEKENKKERDHMSKRRLQDRRLQNSHVAKKPHQQPLGVEM